MRRRKRLVALTAAALSAALAGLTAQPALAVSETYCYPDLTVDPSCDDSNTNLQQVMNLAAADTPADHDTVLLGAGTHSIPGNQGYNLSDPENTVEIRGAGVGVTVLQMSNTTGERSGLIFSAAEGSTLSDFSLEVPAPDDSTGDAGLNLAGQGLTHDVSVTGPDAEEVVGAFVNGEAVLDDAVIDMGPDNFSENWGVRSAVGQPIVTDSVLVGDDAAEAFGSGSTLTVERSALRGERGLSVDTSGSIVARSTTIDLGTIPNARGIAVENTSEGTEPMTLTGENLTIFGGGSGTVGVRAIASSTGSGETATVTLNSTLIDDVGTAIFVGADEGDTATVTTSYSNYDEPALEDDDLDDTGPAGTATLTETDRTSHPVPFFVDSGGGDFHLLPSSPLIDIGDPAAPAGGFLDLDGQARALTGTPACPGPGRRDIGADEFAGAAVLDCLAPDTTATGKKTIKSSKKKVKVSFTLGATEAGSTFECSLDGAAFASCTSPYSRKAKRGKHTLTVRAKDPSGNQDATPATFAFTVKKKKAKKKK